MSTHSMLSDLLRWREAGDDKPVLDADFKMTCPEGVSVPLIFLAGHHGLEVHESWGKVSIAPIRLHLLPPCGEVNRLLMSKKHV